VSERPAHAIPTSWLPPGVVARIGRTPVAPAPPRPAATIVLLRDTAAGPEVLLVRRHHGSAFVPGAYVFPGGRVDGSDADPGLAARVRPLPGPAGPELRFWIAAVRELFEETGVLLARDAAGRPAPESGRDPELARWREELLADAATLADLLAAGTWTIDLTDSVVCAHWITPTVEPRRYDTRFFLARLPARREIATDPREMTDAVWLAPRTALERCRAGRLPMVFPTIRTLEAIAPFSSVDAALAAFRGRTIHPVLPTLVRTPDGVGIIVDDPPTP